MTKVDCGKTHCLFFCLTTNWGMSGWITTIAFLVFSSTNFGSSEYFSISRNIPRASRICFSCIAVCMRTEFLVWSPFPSKHAAASSGFQLSFWRWTKKCWMLLRASRQGSANRFCIVKRKSIRMCIMPPHHWDAVQSHDLLLCQVFSWFSDIVEYKSLFGLWKALGASEDVSAIPETIFDPKRSMNLVMPFRKARVANLKINFIVLSFLRVKR